MNNVNVSYDIKRQVINILLMVLCAGTEQSNDHVASFAIPFCTLPKYVEWNIKVDVGINLAKTKKWYKMVSKCNETLSETM